MSWLTDARLKARLTQDDAAEILDVTRPTWVRLEADPDKLTLRQAAILIGHGFSLTLEGFTPISCPACNGTGILYKPSEAQPGGGGAE